MAESVNVVRVGQSAKCLLGKVQTDLRTTLSTEIVNKRENMEKWKLIENWPAYEVSDHGRVRNLQRQTLKKIFLCDTGQHRPLVWLFSEGKKKKCLVSRLVMIAFNPDRPLKHVVCHNDGNQKNNKLENLRWDTHKSNSHDRFEHGTIIQGEKCNLSKLSQDDILTIRSIEKHRGINKKLATHYGVSINNIWKIRTNRTWKHI